MPSWAVDRLPTGRKDGKSAKEICIDLNSSVYSHRKQMSVLASIGRSTKMVATFGKTECKGTQKGCERNWKATVVESLPRDLQVQFGLARRGQWKQAEVSQLLQIAQNP